MSEDIREEMKKMKEEIANLKEQLKEEGTTRHGRHGGIHVDIGGSVQDYIDDVMQSVAEGVRGELEKSIFIGPRGTRIFARHGHMQGETEQPADLAQAALVMSALGHEHRLKILNEMMNGGKYINELQEKMSDITTSTLSSHLDVLEKAGLVVQEKMRGRYLITIPGRTAYKMATKIANFTKYGDEQ